MKRSTSSLHSWRREQTEGRRTDLRRISPSDEVLRDLFGESITTFVHQARARQEHSWLMHAVQSCIMKSCESVHTELSHSSTERLLESWIDGTIYKRLRDCNYPYCLQLI